MRNYVHQDTTLHITQPFRLSLSHSLFNLTQLIHSLLSFLLLVLILGRSTRISILAVVLWLLPILSAQWHLHRSLELRRV